MAIQTHSHITKLKPGKVMSLGRSLIQDNVNFVVTVMRRVKGNKFEATGDSAPTKDVDFSVDFSAGTVQAITDLPLFYKFDFEYDDNQAAIDAAQAAIDAENTACNDQCTADLAWLVDSGAGGAQETSADLAALDTKFKRLANYLHKMVPIIQRGA